MKSRILFKEIPANKFQSAILTSYTLNFYYFEQQVLRLLNKKGINYVSVLADAAMLNQQFDEMSSFSETRKRSYSLNGIHATGAFHPKINLLVGENAVLGLIGSGNLTSSGHGKNLETWNAIYIDDVNDPKIGLVKQIWDYIRLLHEGLGENAINRLKTIAENSKILSNLPKVRASNQFPIGNNSELSFLNSAPGKSIQPELAKLIGTDRIKKITIMSPYYDVNGSLINYLNETYKPEAINIILQEEFGSIPHKLKPTPNMRFYNWIDIKGQDLKQDYFHAKNIIFEGTSSNYLLTGSANASVPAIGMKNTDAVNYEACFLYKESGKNYLAELGINLSKTPIALSSIKAIPSAELEEQESILHKIKIQSIEQNSYYLSLKYIIQSNITGAILKICSAKGVEISGIKVEFGDKIDSIKLDWVLNNQAFYAVFYDLNGIAQISSKQFITNLDAFEATSPSPNNRRLTEMSKLIEGGQFYSHKIIEYLSTWTKKSHNTKSSSSAEKLEESEESENDKIELDELPYIPYEEMMLRISKLEKENKKEITKRYRTVRLWESILIYLRESKEQAEKEKFDEEELEDVNNSTGRSDPKPMAVKKPIKNTSFQSMKRKVTRFLDSYWVLLEEKCSSDNPPKPSIIDLSMYLVIIEILFHLVDHKEMVEGEDGIIEEKLLLDLKLKRDAADTWSEYVMKLTGMIALWANKANGIEEGETEEEKLKLEVYLNHTKNVGIISMCLFGVYNETVMSNSKIWRNTNVLNTLLAFGDQEHDRLNDSIFADYLPNHILDQLDEFRLKEELLSINKFIYQYHNNNPSELKYRYYLSSNQGYGYIIKQIPETKPSGWKFLKMANPAYPWDEELKDYWNEYLYDIANSKWTRSKNSRKSLSS